MRRHGVVRRPERAREVAGGNRFGMRPHQMPKHAKACRLREGGEAFDGGAFIHVSGRTDIL